MTTVTNKSSFFVYIHAKFDVPEKCLGQFTTRKVIFEMEIFLEFFKNV